MSYKTIQFEQRRAIGILTLNRLERLNALSMECINELRDFFDKLCDKLQMRVVIVRGAGRAFCAGTVLETLRKSTIEVTSEGESGKVQHAFHKMQEPTADVIVKMRRAPQPLIAAVHGPAAEVGFSIAMADWSLSGCV
jgi:enoyl-CoA hydratase